MSSDQDVKKYAKISQKMESRFAPRKKGNPPLQTLGALQHFQPINGGLLIQAQNGSLSLMFLAPNLLQVRVRPDRQFPEAFSYAIDPNFRPTLAQPTIREDADNVLVGVGAMACLISRKQCHLRIVLPSGQEVTLDVGNGLAWKGDQVSWTRHLRPDERCHGLGQRAARLNLRGKKLALWNFDTLNYQRDSDPVYYSIPFYLGVHENYALGVLWDNPARGMVDLGATVANQMQISSESGELRFYLIADQTADKVLKRYFELTGPPMMPPLWAFGYHQSRWSYTPSAKFRQLAAEFRKRQIPCDSLHFDIDYMDGYRVFTWDKTAFGDLSFLLKELKTQGFKSVAIVDPAIKADPNYEAFRSGQQAGVFHTYPDGSLFLGPVWAGESAFPDFTNPVARNWWADRIAGLINAGFDGLWNDMNEPVVFTPKGPGTIPDFIPASWDGRSSTHLDGAHNVYGMQMARATSAGMLKARPGERLFTLTRAAYAGSQRYGGSWTGDNSATWDHLRLSISMVMNLGLSGILFTGPDIGGFQEVPTPELYARWIQAASLFPFCRTHTMKNTPDQEPWSFGKEVENIARKYLTLRYQLMPYLYSSFAQSASLGKPLIYPTFMYDPTDSQLFQQDDVFMVGEALLVAPVLEKNARSRELYLPQGVWYDFWTGKLIDGARTVTVDAPLDTMPIFAKSGKVVPMWEPMQYVGEKRVEELKLHVYAGIGETTFYEDSGQRLDYLNGEYRWSYFSCKYLPSGQFAVDWRTAGNYTPSYERTRLEVMGVPGEPERVLVDGQQAAVWFFEGGIVEVLSAPFQSARLVGKARDDSAAARTIISRSGLPSE